MTIYSPTPGHNPFLSSPDLEVSDVLIRHDGIFFIRVKQREVLLDDGDQKIQHDVGDDDVKSGEKENRHLFVPAVGLPIVLALGCLVYQELVTEEGSVVIVIT